MKKYLALAALALVLAACGGQEAHAASSTNDLIANNVAGNPSADGRIYSFANALYITQNSPSQFTITNADGTTQAIADTNSVKFGALRSWSGFALTWGVFTNNSNQLVFINIGAAKYATCNGGYLSIGTGSSVLNFFDTTTCAQFVALKASAN